MSELREWLVEKLDAYEAWSEATTLAGGNGLAGPLGEFVELLREVLDRLPTGRGGWLPIETVPKDGTNFLACSEASSVFYAHWANGVVDSSSWNDDTGYSGRRATYWMPLPPPPPAGAPA